MGDSVFLLNPKAVRLQFNGMAELRRVAGQEASGVSK